MRLSVSIPQGVEALYGTRDENIRLLETALVVRTRMANGAMEIEGDDVRVERACRIVNDYAELVHEGHKFSSGDMFSYLRIVIGDEAVTLRALVASGRQRSFGKKVLTPKTINQRRYLEAIERNDLVFGVGPAGTGKTYLAVAMAVSALLSKRVSRIILTRPAVEAGEKLGFLPGTLQEKIDPYLRPLYDALFDMLEAEKVEKFIEKNIIEVAPLAFMRGRTLNDSFIILDEAQNSTPEQMKMVLTRQGFSSKTVVTGDATQIDLPSGRRSGLIEAVEILKGIDGISFVHFDDGDVVRHSLVQRIIRAYEKSGENAVNARQLKLRLNEVMAEADCYLDKFAFRFNRREFKGRDKVFFRRVRQAVAVETAPYDAIVQRTARKGQKAERKLLGLRECNTYPAMGNARTEVKCKIKGRRNEDEEARRSSGGQRGSCRRSIFP